MLAVTDFLPTATVTAAPAEESLPAVDENESESDESVQDESDDDDDRAARIATFERIEQQFFIKMAVQAASAAFIGVAIIMHGISTASACSF